MVFVIVHQAGDPQNCCGRGPSPMHVARSATVDGARQVSLRTVCGQKKFEFERLMFSEPEDSSLCVYYFMGLVLSTRSTRWTRNTEGINYAAENCFALCDVWLVLQQ